MLTQAVFFLNIFLKYYLCDAKLNFQHHYSSLFFMILSSKEQHFLKDFFSYNVKVFTVIDQINVSLLNKSTFLNIFLKKKKTF